MRLIKSISLAALLSLAACDNGIVAEPTKLPTVAPPATRDIQVQSVNIEVVTRENIARIQSEVAGNRDSVFLFLTPRDYENLMSNLADIQRYITQQQAVIKYYVTIVQGDTLEQTVPTEPDKAASPSTPAPRSTAGSKPVPRQHK